MDTHARTDVGCQRETNEDAVLETTVGDGATLLAVADGMGGHQAGEVASRTAVTELAEHVGQNLADPTADEQLLCNAVHAANRELHSRAAADSTLEGMGTTLVAALLRGASVTLVNVGDSRAYHLTDDRLAQVTADHSLVQELVESGELSPEKARTHPQRNVITQALGTTERVDPDTFTVDLNGTLLLCSDGLTEEVLDEEIHQIHSDSQGLPAVGDRLIEAANENGGSDNVSVVLASPETAIST